MYAANPTYVARIRATSRDGGSECDQTLQRLGLP